MVVITYACFRFKTEKYKNYFVEIKNIFSKKHDIVSINPKHKDDFNSKQKYYCYYKNCFTDDCENPLDICCGKYSGFIACLGESKEEVERMVSKKRVIIPKFIDSSIDSNQETEVNKIINKKDVIINVQNQQDKRISEKFKYKNFINSCPKLTLNDCQEKPSEDDGSQSLLESILRRQSYLQKTNPYLFGTDFLKKNVHREESSESIINDNNSSKRSVLQKLDHLLNKKVEEARTSSLSCVSSTQSPLVSKQVLNEDNNLLTPKRYLTTKKKMLYTISHPLTMISANNKRCSTPISNHQPVSAFETVLESPIFNTHNARKMFISSSTLIKSPVRWRSEFLGEKQSRSHSWPRFMTSKRFRSYSETRNQSLSRPHLSKIKTLNSLFDIRSCARWSPKYRMIGPLSSPTTKKSRLPLRPNSRATNKIQNRSCSKQLHGKTIDVEIRVPCSTVNRSRSGSSNYSHSRADNHLCSKSAKRRRSRSADRSYSRSIHRSHSKSRNRSCSKSANCSSPRSAKYSLPRLINRSRSKSVNRSRRRSADRSCSTSANHSHSESGDRSLHGSVDRSHSRSINRSRSKSVNRSRRRSADRSCSTSANHSHSESGDRSLPGFFDSFHPRSINRLRSKSVNRSHCRSDERSRSTSANHSHSKSGDRSLHGSVDRSHSRSINRSRSKSVNRSRSRSAGRSRLSNRSYSISIDRSRSNSVNRSRPRLANRSRSRSRSSESNSSEDYDEDSLIPLIKRFKPRIYKDYMKADPITPYDERYRRYETLGDKIYLGLGIRVGLESWKITNCRSSSTFLRELSTYIWKKHKIANRCLDLGKLRTAEIPNRSPRKMYSPLKLELYLTLYKDFLDTHPAYKNISRHKRTALMQKATNSLSIHSRDERNRLNI